MPELLEQLDLLLIQEVRARRVRRAGIHCQSKADRDLLIGISS
jgi:hypothetical protein